jgi:non-specific serine/threonine protein kinase
MLAAPEQQLFNSLAVFAGGWTLEAAETVCPDAALRTGQVLGLLKRLVDTSLVQVETDPLGGGYRYGMLETVRAYGREQLAARQTTDAVAARHAQYYLKLAEQAEPALRGAQQTAWLERLEQEHDNLRAALEWLHTTADVEGALRLAGALWRFWYLHDYLSEGRRWLEAALALRSSALPTATSAAARVRARIAAARGKALHGAGVLVYVQGEYARAQALYQEALAVRRRLRDPWGTSESLSNLGLLLYGQGDYDQAQRFYEEALALRQELDDQWGVGHALSYLGMVAHRRGDYVRARALLEESLALFRRMERRNAIAGVLTSLGEVTLYWGDVAGAQQAYAEGLVQCQELGQKRCIAACLAGLAAVAGAQGDPERAARLFGSAEALREIIGAELQPVDRGEYDRLVAASRAHLAAAAWDRAWAEGRALPLERARAYALEGPAPSRPGAGLPQ